MANDVGTQMLRRQARPTRLILLRIMPSSEQGFLLRVLVVMALLLLLLLPGGSFPSSQSVPRSKDPQATSSPPLPRQPWTDCPMICVFVVADYLVLKLTAPWFSSRVLPTESL